MQDETGTTAVGPKADTGGVAKRANLQRAPPSLTPLPFTTEPMAANRPEISGYLRTKYWFQDV